MASVRFICGTQTVHRELERRLSAFLGTEDTILYSSCFDANGGLFETLTDDNGRDHLGRAEPREHYRRHPPVKGPPPSLRQRRPRPARGAAAEASDARTRLVVTDGVFSMDGTIATLAGICELADRHGATRDRRRLARHRIHGRRRSRHARALRRHGPRRRAHRHARQGARRRERRLRLGPRGRSSAWLRQRSRPYLFSNTIAPVVAATTLAVLDLIESLAGAAAPARRQRRVVPRAARRPQGFKLAARRTSDHPGHARRRGARGTHGEPPARTRRLRDRLLLPGRPDGQGADSDADVRRPHARRCWRPAVAALSRRRARNSASSAQ